jgi:hypothetical protein
MSFFNPFSQSSRAGSAWFCAGLASAYPNVDDSSRVSEQRLCRGKFTPGCRIFHVPREDSSKASEVAIDDWRDPEVGNPKDQVMVFQYKGKFVAINHVCPAKSDLPPTSIQGPAKLPY